MKLRQHLSNKLFEALLQLAYPPVCISCNQLIRESTPIRQLCPDCLASFQPVPRNLVRDSVLQQLESPYLDEILVAVKFDEKMQTVIHHFKYRRMNHLAFQIAGFLKKYLSENLRTEKFDRVFPVPLHPVREKERGYNQSAHIARGLFDGSATPVVCGKLIRVRQTASQTQLNREERRVNVSGAFQLLSTEIVAGKTIALVDDVITTGATLNECARVLKESGAKRIIGVALSSPLD